MARLLVHVEGQTEEAFVSGVLRAHLVPRGYHSVEARIVGNVRRMGICSWPSAKKEIVNRLHEDPASIATTMVDYYALPRAGQRGWPGRAQSGTFVSVQQKALCVEDAIRDDISKAMGPRFNAHRFVPFVVMHEFEGLLFSDCAAFSRGIDRRDLQDSLQAIRDAFATPEEINDSSATAPSKRIRAIMPSYQKPFHGILAALTITLPRMRAECPLFNAWIEQLEARTG